MQDEKKKKFEDLTPAEQAGIMAIIRDWINRRIEFENPDDPQSRFRLRPEKE